MKIIENAEIMGYKGKNIVSALSDRISINLEKIIDKKKILKIKNLKIKCIIFFLKDSYSGDMKK